MSIHERLRAEALAPADENVMFESDLERLAYVAGHCRMLGRPDLSAICHEVRANIRANAASGAAPAEKQP